MGDALRHGRRLGDVADHTLWGILIGIGIVWRGPFISLVVFFLAYGTSPVRRFYHLSAFGQSTFEGFSPLSVVPPDM
jgi:hypothetical protein